MKFTCTKTNFNNGINIALKAVPGKTTMPILECVVIEAKGDMVKLTTNDMQLGIETKIPAEIEQDGIILVNAKMISEIVRRLPDDDVNLKLMRIITFSCFVENPSLIFRVFLMMNFRCFQKLKRIRQFIFRSLP